MLQFKAFRDVNGRTSLPGSFSLVLSFGQAKKDQKNNFCKMKGTKEILADAFRLAPNIFDKYIKKIKINFSEWPLIKTYFILY